MAATRPMSQVRFKVRYNARMLREFTTAEMVRATGLNPQSVQTEIQRMKQEKILSSSPDPRQERGRGRRVIYRLSDDPVARSSLSKSIDDFFVSDMGRQRPTSRYYHFARRLLDEAEAEEGQERRVLIERASNDLSLAEQAEDHEYAPDTVQMHLRLERARILYLRTEYDSAHREFADLREFFSELRDEDVVQRIDQYLLCMQAWLSYRSHSILDLRVQPWAQHLNAVLANAGYRATDPIQAFLLRLLRRVALQPSEMIADAASQSWSQLEPPGKSSGGEVMVSGPLGSIFRMTQDGSLLPSSAHAGTRRINAKGAKARRESFDLDG
jgi:hypothetical protein